MTGRLVATPRHELTIFQTPEPALHLAPGNDSTLPTDTKFVNVPITQRVYSGVQFKRDESEVTDDSIQKIIDKNNR